MTADQVKLLLGLAPHPREGGWFVRTYEAGLWLPDAHGMQDTPALQEADGLRRAATAIYYLLEPGTFSEMHRLRSDEMFHFYAGCAVEQLQLLSDGGGRRVVIGNDLAAGQRPQVLVERGVWQGARLARPREHGSAAAGDGEWALLGCTVSPGFEFADYESGRAEELARGWPEWEQEIRELCRE